MRALIAMLAATSATVACDEVCDTCRDAAVWAFDASVDAGVDGSIDPPDAAPSPPFTDDDSHAMRCAGGAGEPSLGCQESRHLSVVWPVLLHSGVHISLPAGPKLVR